MYSYSVIIPAKNESANIARCIRSVVNSVVNEHQLEIFVVDNGSIDNTLEIAEQEGAEAIVNRTANISGLRNTGARRAAHEIIAFIDADCEACAGWLENAEKILQDPGIGIVGDYYRLPQYPGWIEKVLFSNIPRCRREVSYLSGGNMIMRKDTFFRVKGFDESTITGEDYVLCLKMKNFGYKIIADPGVSVIHHGNAKTLSGYFKREAWCGLGMLDLVRYEKITLPLIWSFINVFLLFFILLSLIVGTVYQALPLILVLALIPAGAVTLKAVKSGAPKNVFQSYLVYSVYGFARTFSLFKRLKLEMRNLRMLDPNYPHS